MKADRILVTINCIVLILLCAIGNLPGRAEAAEPGAKKKAVWTVTEAEIARERADNVPLLTILKNAVNSGETIQDVIAAAVHVDIDPTLLVSTAIAGGYPAQTVVKAALQAGAPRNAVLKGAAAAGVDIKTLSPEVVDTGAAPSKEGKAKPASGQLSPKKTLSPESSVPAPALIGAGGIVLTPFPAPARENIVIDGMIVNPFITVRETYSDNVYYTGVINRQSDFITTLAPGVRMKSTSQLLIPMELELYSVFSRYKKQSEANTTDHHIRGAVDLKPGGQLGLTISDTFDKGHEPLSSSPTSTGIVETFKTNALALSASFPISFLSRIQLDYTRSSWRFDHDEFRSRDEDLVSLSYFFKVIAQTSVFAEYDQTNVAYVDDSFDLNGTVGRVRAGLSWDAGMRYRVTVKAGLARKDFKSATRTDLSAKVGSADIRYDLTDDLTLIVIGQRDLHEPNVPGMASYLTFGGYSELLYRYDPKLTAFVRISQVRDYYGFRTDTTSLAGAGFRYPVRKWADVSVDYSKQARHASNASNEYSEQSYTCMVHMSF